MQLAIMIVNIRNKTAKFMRSIFILFFYSVYNSSYSDVILLDNDAKDTVWKKIDNNANTLSKHAKTWIKYDAEQLNSVGKAIVKKVNAITYFTFGTDGKQLIEIYVSPSCLHCAQFLIEDLEKFVKQHKDHCFIKVMLIPVTAKDFFIMKLIQAEAKDTNGYYMIFLNYMKRAIATMDSIIPSKEQIAKYQGSNTDPDMIKYQVIASDFKFSDEKIINSIPNTDEDYELAVMEYYKKTVKEIFEKLKLDTTKNSELEVPLIICNNKSYKTLDKAFNDNLNY